MWLMILVGIIGGGLLASIVAFGLASIILFSPLAGLCGLGGEFDGLWIMGLPVFTLPCGAIGGAVLGGTRKWPRGTIIALACASLPAAAYFFANAWGEEMTKNARDVFVSTSTLSLCMAISAAISIQVIRTILSAIEKYRTKLGNTSQEQAG